VQLREEKSPVEAAAAEISAEAAEAGRNAAEDEEKPNTRCSCTDLDHPDLNNFAAIA